MKKSRRIFAILLVFTLLLSCLFLTTATAEEPFKAQEISDIEDILEYYTLKDYIADSYEGETWSSDYYQGDNSSVVEDPTDSANKVLKVTAKNDKYSISDVSAESLIVSFEFFYDSTMTGEYRVDLKTKDAAGVEDATYSTMFSVSAKDGKFRNSVWNASLNNGEGAFELKEYVGVVPKADRWYKVVIFFNPAESKYSFKVSEDRGDTWFVSEDFSMGPAEVVSDFLLRTYAYSREDSVSLYLDNVEVYCGTFERNHANKNNITAQTIIDLGAMYNNEATSSADKVRIATVLDKLINKYNFVPSANTPELDAVNAVIANVSKYVTVAFAAEVVNRANAIDKTLGYDARIAYINESSYYLDSMPSDDELANMDGLKDNPELVAAVKAAREKFAEEQLDCDKVAQDSKNFVIKMADYDSDSTDYDGYLKAFYEEVTAYPDVDFTYDFTYTEKDYGMSQASADFLAFSAKYNKLNDAANAFITGAQMMQKALADMSASQPKDETYESAFADLSAGYFMADAVYNGGDIDKNLDESTHKLLISLFGVYTDNKDFVLTQIAACEQFLDVMKRANTATYYAAIKAELEEAAKYIGAARTMYPGVPEAIELYEKLTNELADSEKTAQDYIAAVNAILEAKTFEKKQETIENALLLKEAGDVTGIAGVKEANIILSEQMTAIETLVSNSEVLMSVVEELNTATAMIAKRELIKRANQAILNYEQSLKSLCGEDSSADFSIDGILEAIEDIDAFTVKYVESITAKNDAHSAAVQKAVDVAGSMSGAENVYKAADVIKNYIG